MQSHLFHKYFKAAASYQVKFQLQISTIWRGISSTLVYC